MRTNYVNEIDARIQGTDGFQKLVPFLLPSKIVDVINEDDIKRIPIINYQILILKYLLLKKKYVKLLYGYL